MEIFYKYLGGPRTFWGHGNNTRVINNYYFGGAPLRSYGRPVFSYAHHMPLPFIGYQNYCTGGNIFNLMAGFTLASSLMQNLMPETKQQVHQNNYYQVPQNYTQINPNYDYFNNYLNDVNSHINSIEDRLNVYEQQIADLKKERENSPVEANTDNTQNSDEKLQNTNSTQETENNIASAETPVKAPAKSDTETTEAKTNASTLDNEEESIYKFMKDSGFNELDSHGKDYINSHISSYYKDNDGTIKFNIKAIVHDGDTIDDIKARFYTKDENPDISVNNHKFHTQNSENTIMDNPFSGDTILLNGVSEFGLKALMNEAKNGITRDGEITKTNKKMAELKTAFINGKQKLSKAYVIQNHLLTENQYNKIIKEKYS